MAYRNRMNPYLTSGTASIGGTAVPTAGQVNVFVPFGRTYDTPPRVIVSLAAAPGGSATLVPRALNATTTGFTLYVYNVGAADATWGTMLVNWLAVS